MYHALYIPVAIRSLPHNRENAFKNAFPHFVFLSFLSSSQSRNQYVNIIVVHIKDELIHLGVPTVICQYQFFDWVTTFNKDVRRMSGVATTFFRPPYSPPLLPCMPLQHTSTGCPTQNCLRKQMQTGSHCKKLNKELVICRSRSADNR